VAETITMPIDVVKTRMQMPNHGYSGSVDAATTMVKNEGIGVLFKGIGPALARQATYGSMRYGFYNPIKGYLGIPADMPKSEIPILLKATAAIAAGAIASFLANPLDLAKVRMQVSQKSVGLGGTIMLIVKEEGFWALWNGVGPTCARAAFLTAGELVTNDEARTMLVGFGVSGIMLVFASAMCSGFVGVGLSNPFDVAKSRVMGQPVGADGKGKLYSGMVDCFQKSIASEGIGCLMKGFFQNYTRKGPHVIIVFICIEQMKALVDVYGDSILYALIVCMAIFYLLITSEGKTPQNKSGKKAASEKASK
jgi:hypothetical protein